MAMFWLRCVFMRIGPNIRQRIDGRFEARYEKARDSSGRIIYGYCYGKTYEEAAAKRAAILGLRPQASTKSVRRMNLLILGAGSQGSVVKETAEALGVFHQIAYLDDDAANPLAIDTCANYEKYVDLYPIAIASFGDCKLRAVWMRRLEDAGFIIPTLVHSMATVSPSAVIEEGTLVEMKAIIGTGAHIKQGCIISSGAVVDLDAVVEENAHVGSSVTVRRGAVVPAFSMLQSGSVFGE